MKTVNIYTDGACSGNQNENNVGGWGCVLEYCGREKELCGGEVNTTNNRMELTALIEGLSALKEPGLNLVIFSDSSYLINCFRNGWYVSWQKNDWKNAKKQPVENRQLWEKLLELLKPHKASFYLVKGHLKLTDDNPEALSAAYQRFVKNNGPCFDQDRFKQISDYNNRCDALANVFINEQRKASQSCAEDQTQEESRPEETAQSEAPDE